MLVLVVATGSIAAGWYIIFSKQPRTERSSDDRHLRFMELTSIADVEAMLHESHALIFFQSTSCVPDVAFVKQMDEDENMPTELRNRLRYVVVNNLKFEDRSKLSELVAVTTGSDVNLPRFDIPYGNSTFLLKTPLKSHLVALTTEVLEEHSIVELKIKPLIGNWEERNEIGKGR